MNQPTLTTGATQTLTQAALLAHFLAAPLHPAECRHTTVTLAHDLWVCTGCGTVQDGD